MWDELTMVGLLMDDLMDKREAFATALRQFTLHASLSYTSSNSYMYLKCLHLNV
jgi:hypothetical protein